jgi:hypothetical protein
MEKRSKTGRVCCISWGVVTKKEEESATRGRTSETTRPHYYCYYSLLFKVLLSILLLIGCVYAKEAGCVHDGQTMER